MSRRSRSAVGGSITIEEALINAGLPPALAAVLDRLPHRVVEVDSRRPFREPGSERSEVFFVSSGNT